MVTYDECSMAPDGASSLIGVGVGLGLLSSALSDTGLILEKKALNTAAAIVGADHADKIPFWKLPLWWIGFALFALGQILTAVAMSMTSTLILAPLGGFALVVNVFNTAVILKEPVVWQEVACTLVIIAGSALSAIFGPVVDTQPSLHCINKGLAREPFVISAVSLVVAQLALYMVSRRGTKSELAKQHEHAMQAGSLKSGYQWSTRGKLCKWAYPVLSGSMQVWTLLIGAAVSRMWSEILFQHKHEFLANWQPWVFLVLWIPCAAMWQLLISASLVFLDARYVIPADFTCQVLINMVISGTFYNEYTEALLPHHKLPWFLLGVLLTVLGVLLLSLVSKSSAPGEDPATVEDITRSLSSGSDTVAAISDLLTSSFQDEADRSKSESGLRRRLSLSLSPSQLADLDHNINSYKVHRQSPAPSVSAANRRRSLPVNLFFGRRGADAQRKDLEQPLITNVSTDDGHAVDPVVTRTQSGADTSLPLSPTAEQSPSRALFTT